MVEAAIAKSETSREASKARGSQRGVPETKKPVVFNGLSLERVTGVEPATLCLASTSSQKTEVDGNDLCSRISLHY